MGQTKKFSWKDYWPAKYLCTFSHLTDNVQPTSSLISIRVYLYHFTVTSNYETTADNSIQIFSKIVCQKSANQTLVHWLISTSDK